MTFSISRSLSRYAFVITVLATPSAVMAHETGTGVPDADAMPMQHDMMDHAGHMAGMAGAPGMMSPDDMAEPDDMMQTEDMPGMAAMPEGVTEPGQAAFAAIQQIVEKLMADPTTDWSKVDVEALRQHLIDMDNVTLHAQVKSQAMPDGANFEATSSDPAVINSIRTMVSAHVATMNGANGWAMRSAEIPGGASLTVSGKDPVRIQALGFIGVMTAGMHHQAHHLALATGQNPHTH